MSDSWDDAATTWDHDPAARAYADAVMTSLRTELESLGFDLAGATVCDFGCGTGLLTERLTDRVAAIDAVDTSSAMLDVLDQKIETNGWTHVRTGSELPTGSRTHDLVVCSSVCSFLDDYPATVRRLVTLLRPGGVFVQWDWERVDDDPHGLTRSEITGALTSAGLVDVGVETAFEVGVEFDGERHVMRPLIGVGRRPSGDGN